ncbi:MAG: c-type cytochrome [Caulobacteraceae bacterium]
MKSALAGAIAAALMLAGAASAAPDPAKGKAVFNEQCSLCHSASPGVEGAAPSLSGVVGRKAAGDPKFVGYTPALKKLGVAWTPAGLDRFLANPGAVAPGTAMPINVASAADRQDLIAYLSSLKAGR